MPRAASPHGGNLVAAVRSLFKRSNKASSDAGPELAGRDGHVAMESPQALMCPLEKGVRGIKISGLCRCSASLTSVSQHGCLVFFGARLSCSPP